MSNSVVVALIGFGRTLQDTSEEDATKLRVLSTLNEVALTLSELSESGVGRAVSGLKNAPGELGTTARTLVNKWKQLLRTHAKEAALTLPEPVNQREEQPEPPQSKSERPNSLVQAGKKRRSASDLHPSPPTQTSPPLSPVREKKSNQNQTPSSESSKRRSTTITTTTTIDDSQPTPSSSHASDTKHGTSPPTVPTKDSLDSSSGLSFLQSLTVGNSGPRKRKAKAVTPTSKSNTRASPSNGFVRSPASLTTATASLPPMKPSKAFTEEILSSLSVDCDRPDIIHKSTTRVPRHNAFEDDEDDGDLKFKSKKILWCPKPSRNPVTHSDSLASSFPDNHLDGMDDGPKDARSLLDLCLDVVQQNLSRVDSVGQVPYELLARTLKHASADDLARIENCNPQFIGLSDELWQRHVQRTFHGSHRGQLQPSGPEETWCAFYERLSREEATRLDRLISRSARRVREELEGRRTTLTTDVIAPRQVQRLGGRQSSTHSRSSSSQQRSSHGSSDRGASSGPFRPYNVSRPTGTASSGSSGSNSTTAGRDRHFGPSVSHRPEPSGPLSDRSGGAGRGNLLKKLRRQFRSGQLR